MARILVADDDEDLAWAWSRSLNGHGHSCTAVHTGRDARALLEATPFDLLIADILMPNGGGVLLAGFRDALYPGVKVLIVTGEAKFSEWNESGSQIKGSEMMLFKPITNDVLFETVDTLLSEAPPRQRRPA